ncbi:mannosyl-oligosaccharide alpha-1,2-mannosidase [Coemansia guatemalensis]|uniref:alpha-1,2-Mannosidase n=1 Tax=Coemansia guatemalensis TaxID=2761395 RepID=A0A9W8LTB1_9FUNG|nr:mannosyl-oligosaccharide alpha-1,2-mannosidase [Coemansia guatemalensis]
MRYRNTDRHEYMKQWPGDLATNWRATQEQQMKLDDVIREAHCEDCRDSSLVDWAQRRKQVVSAAKRAWDFYYRDAFGLDEYRPISHSGRNFTQTGLGYYIADVLDTLWLMGLKDEYKVGRDFLVSQVTFEQPGSVSLFETTIRLLGGLLSAYHWSGETDRALLEVADQLGSRLAMSFNTSTGIPPETAILRSDGMPFAVESSTSEVSTLQLEFRYLAKLTGKQSYQQQVDRIMDIIFKAPKFDGLVSNYINAASGEFTGTFISLGSRGDSYYEYLLKQWLQTRQTEPIFREEYDSAMDGVRKYLATVSPNQNLTYIGELLRIKSATPKFSPKMDHLACFLAGNLALGSTNGVPLSDILPSSIRPRDREDLILGRELGETCAHMYFDTPSGLAPEIGWFRQVDSKTGKDIPFNSDEQLIKPDGDILVHTLDRHYILRPETVESFYLLWKITGETKWREYGWRVFEAIEKWAWSPEYGYTSIDNVCVIPPTRRDSIETFFLSETLKYLYLLFNDADPTSLVDHVFNSEAHPLPMFTWE